ncbi:nucleoside 2-deoxyribosyltransferase [Methyloligella sp. 2.7D]|uniref:nucleoside 2-deoxyribosyltransferase n=1 Tax=Methyloligella sp. 2.7D TaxID=3085160 RepID=UPI002FDA524F
MYLAGPLGFSEAGRAFHQQEIVARLERLGHVLHDPWEEDEEIARIAAMPYGAQKRAAWQAANLKIGRKNQDLIDGCDVVFAVLDGVDVDSGTAAEIGYAFARQKPIVGYRGDFRLSADNEGGIVNLQVEYFIRASGGTIIRELSELDRAIAACA